jgi:dihydrodipicolinate synthase/N-acetylneuraminate lyase
MPAFRGVYVVNVTPFTPERQVDYPGLVKNIHWLVEQGVQGLIPLGSTGEFASLEDADKRKVVETVVAAAGGKVPVMVGVAAETTEKTIENARMAEREGASSLLVLPPWYYTPDQDEIFEHYQRINDATELPIMIYNNPFTSKVDIQAATVARLARLKQVQGIKESTGEIRRKAALQLFDLVVERGDCAAGWKLYKRMLPMLRFLEYAGKTQKALKHVLDGMGLAGGACSSPKLPLDAETRAQVDALLRDFRQGEN